MPKKPDSSAGWPPYHPPEMSQPMESLARQQLIREAKVALAPFLENISWEEDREGMLTAFAEALVDDCAGFAEFARQVGVTISREFKKFLETWQQEHIN